MGMPRHELFERRPAQEKARAVRWTHMTSGVDQATSELIVAVHVTDHDLRLRLAASLEVDGGQPRIAADDNGADVAVVAGSDPAEVRNAIERHFDAQVVVVHPEMSALDLRTLIAAGARGFVPTDQADAVLPATVRAVQAGQMVLPATYHFKLDRPNLTMREKQLLGMVVLGFSNAEISNKLFLAESTVKSHLSSAFAKLGVRSRKDAAALILDPNGSLGAGILTAAPRSPAGR